MGRKHMLNKKQKQILVDEYQTDKPREQIYKELSERFCCTTRTIRKYAADIGVGGNGKGHKGRVMVYDIETSRIESKVWRTGKQYIGYKQLKGETTIISISWKWIGDDKVHHLTWDKDHSDKAMVTKFIKEYNKASVVIGFNNDSFDNKIVCARALKYRLELNIFTKSFDIYKRIKKLCKLESYSMDYMCKYFGITTQKLKHEGIYMWDMIEDGTPKQQKEYLKKMVDYNIGDIIATEELYMTFRHHFTNVTNVAVQSGQPKWACPITGSTDVTLCNTVYTAAGTVQRILYCKLSNHQYKVTNRSYMEYLERQMYS